MYFSPIFICLLRLEEPTLTNSLLLCKASDKSAAKFKYFFSNDKAILTYWFLKNILFGFYKRASATSSYFNRLKQISFMSYRKDLNDKFQKNKLTASKLRLLFILSVRVDMMAESWRFSSNISNFLLLISNTYMLKPNACKHSVKDML